MIEQRNHTGTYSYSIGEILLKVKFCSFRARQRCVLNHRRRRHKEKNFFMVEKKLFSAEKGPKKFRKSVTKSNATSSQPRQAFPARNANLVHKRRLGLKNRFQPNPVFPNTWRNSNTFETGYFGPNIFEYRIAKLPQNRQILGLSRPFLE